MWCDTQKLIRIWNRFICLWETAANTNKFSDRTHDKEVLDMLRDYKLTMALSYLGPGSHSNIALPALLCTCLCWYPRHDIQQHICPRVTYKPYLPHNQFDRNGVAERSNGYSERAQRIRAYFHKSIAPGVIRYLHLKLLVIYIYIYIYIYSHHLLK